MVRLCVEAPGNEREAVFGRFSTTDEAVRKIAALTGACVDDVLDALRHGRPFIDERGNAWSILT